MVRHRSGEVSCEIVDIGLGGIAVRGPESIAPGDFVRVSFGLGAANGPAMKDADGVVARVESPRGQTPGLIGIQFTVVEGPIAVEIHDYIRRQREARHPGPIRRTGGYAAVGAYPVADRDDSMPIHTAPVTGEYQPAGYGNSDMIQLDEDVALGATGTDTEVGPAAADDRDGPIDREVLRLFLRAQRTPVRPREKN